MKLVFASHNSNKVKEISSLFPTHYELLSLADIHFHEEIVESSNTLEGNSQIKARTVFEKTGFYCFADDTGLEVEALENRPGVHSARYAGFPKNEEANIEKLLTELHTSSNRKAQFRTVFTLIIPEGEFQFEGVVNGNIDTVRKGSQGFGYDSVFVPENEIITFAEMSLAEKNKYSHRARALGKMIEFLTNLNR